MPENPPPGTVENHAHHRPAALTAEALEAVLGDFRIWAQEAAALGQGALPPEPEETPLIDLHTLLGQLTALRHEVHLLTRAARGQQEQSAETLRELSEALDLLQQNQARLRQAEQQISEEALRPLLKTLVDVHDALMLAEREVRRVQETVLPILDQAAVSSEILSPEEEEPEPPGSLLGESDPAWPQEERNAGLEEEPSESARLEEGIEICGELAREDAAPTAALPPQEMIEPSGITLPEPPPSTQGGPMDILASLPPTPAPSFWARFFGLDRTIRQQQETIAALSKELTQERAYRQSAGLVASADPNLPWQETPRAALSLEPGDVGEPEEPPIVASDRQEPGDDTEDPASPPIPQEVVERAQQMLGSLVTGYKMSVQRIDRALEQLGLEPISAVGQSFDPEYMEVLEAVPDSGYPPGEVLEEVRRGYVWRGRVFRYAQVRVARS